jgi:DNA-binding beta-propeller fold protein YncE
MARIGLLAAAARNLMLAMLVTSAVGALTLATAPGAIAATNLTQVPGVAGCITESGAEECQQGRSLVGPASIALSPDGDNAYVASSEWDSLSALTRDPGDGALAPIASQAGCFDSRTPENPECANARQLGGAADVAVSPDGKNVYVAAPADDALVIFDRDPVTGELTLSSAAAGCVNQNGSDRCEEGRALEGATSVAVSPDGQNVYLAASGVAGGISVFDREPGTGDLLQMSGTDGCLNETGAEGCAVGLNLVGVASITISPDGKTLYAVSPSHEAVTIYARDPSTGVLSPIARPAGCVASSGAGGCRMGTAMIGPISLVISPDGHNAYVAGESSESIAIFDRDPDNGELTQKPGVAGCVSKTGLSNPMQAGTAGACQRGLAMEGINSIAIPADGTALYATASGSSGVVVFERHSDGSLTQRPGAEACITETGQSDPGLPWTAGACQKGRALRGAADVVASLDSHFAYTVAKNGGVGIFSAAQAPPFPGPETARPAAPPIADKGNGCAEIRASTSTARHHIKRARHSIQRQAHAVRRARRRIAKRKLSHALRRSHRLLKLWSARERADKRRLQNLCPRDMNAQRPSASSAR